ncbi:MAG: hypothetical protein Q7S16_05685 [bacterium]|nr:hypothetical protein [bacterium]
MKKNGQTIFSLFQTTAKEVNAYKIILREQGVVPKKITTLEQFRHLPILDKKTYINRFPLSERIPTSSFPPMAYASSGSSGTPTYWFVNDAQEKIGGNIHEYIFRNMFAITEQSPTLVVVCFAMGVWVAGHFTLASCRNIAQKGYQLTCITPSINMNDVLDVLARFAPKYKNIILAGYPPFLMDVLRIARQRRILLHKNKIGLLTAGTTFSEQWRDTAHTLIGSPNAPIVNVYGSADAGMLGHETTLTIALRRYARINSDFSCALFGSAVPQAGLYQYHPEHVFFEEHAGELLITANTAIPLVRYNIHDRGRIFSPSALRTLLTEMRAPKKFYTLLKDFSLPLVRVDGRTDVATTFYALNIYPEHLEAAVDQKPLRDFFSGNFIVYRRQFQKAKREQLCIRLELAAGKTHTQELIALCVDTIVRTLQKKSIEYKKLHASIGKAAIPIVEVYAHGDPHIHQARVPGFLRLKGKKIRMLA